MEFEQNNTCALPFSWYSILETGRTNLPYDNVLCCYAQEWMLIEYNVLDARLKQNILYIVVDDILLT